MIREPGRPLSLSGPDRKRAKTDCGGRGRRCLELTAGRKVKVGKLPSQ